MGLTGLGGIIGAIIIISVLSVISIPLLTQTANNATVTQANSINSTNQQLLGQQIYQPLNKTVFSGSGFASNIASILGYAFVFPAMLQFMEAIVRIPTVATTDLNGLLVLTGIPTLGAVSIGVIVGALTVYFGLYIIALGVGAWSKFDFWHN